MIFAESLRFSDEDAWTVITDGILELDTVA